MRKTFRELEAKMSPAARARVIGDTPLQANIWDDEDFEEEETKEETEDDRKIAALEAVRKKKESDAKCMKWAEPNTPTQTSANSATKHNRHSVHHRYRRWRCANHLRKRACKARLGPEPARSPTPNQ